MDMRSKKQDVMRNVWTCQETGRTCNDDDRVRWKWCGHACQETGRTCNDDDRVRWKWCGHVKRREEHVMTMTE